jgi:hypothetical protein
MSIPFLLLRHVRISRQQKMALSGIFSLVVFTIIFAVVRAILTTVHVGKQMDPIWMYLWTSIELNVGKTSFRLTPKSTCLTYAAIVVACIAPYRTIFLREREPKVSSIHPRINHDLNARALKLFTSTKEKDIVTPAESSVHAPWNNGEGNDGNCGERNPLGVWAEDGLEGPRLGVIPSASDSIDGTPWPERRRDNDEELAEVQKHIISRMPKLQPQCGDRVAKDTQV